MIYLDVSLLSTHFMEHFLHDRAQKRMAIKGFLVLELITGGELFDFIVEQHTLSEKVASSFIQQILGVLNYCHKRGRLHFYSLSTIDLSNYGFSFYIYKPCQKQKCGLTFKIPSTEIFVVT